MLQGRAASASAAAAQQQEDAAPPRRPSAGWDTPHVAWGGSSGLGGRVAERGGMGGEEGRVVDDVVVDEEQQGWRVHLGEVMSSIPMLTRLRSPPDTPLIISSPTFWSATLPRPSSSMTCADSLRYLQPTRNRKTKQHGLFSRPVKAQVSNARRTYRINAPLLLFDWN
jgi:hypothetical protein